MPHKICDHCGIEFDSSLRTKWCDDCRFITFTCAACGTEKATPRTRYEAPLPDGSPKTKHFCSKHCAITYGSKIAAKLRENKVTVTCPNCGALNERKAAHAKRVFCDRSCYAEHRRKYPDFYPRGELGPEALAKLKARTGKNNPAYGMTGDKSPHWKGGRTKYRGKGWSTIRKLIQRRDKHQCALCHKTKKKAAQLDVHHIFDWAETECNHPHNLITLCATCHQGRIHGNEPAPPNHQLAALAQAATHERLAPDDRRLIVSLDRQQRDGKGLPWYVVETLGLPESYLADWQQLVLPEFDLSVVESHRAK